MGDIFLAPVVIIYGTIGKADSDHHNATVADEIASFFRRWNGGVHRGGISGDIEVRIPILSDKQMLDLEQGRITSVDEEEDGFIVDKKLVERANLFLIGNSTSNSVTNRLADQLPFSIHKDNITLGGKKYAGSSQACLAVFPHPDHDRYVVVLAGQTSDAICGASHIGLQLVPDFLVFEQEKIIDWGFFDNNWRHEP